MPLPTTESADVMVWYAAADGSVAAPNPPWEALTGQAHAEYRAWGWLDAIHPADSDRVRQHWMQAVAAGEAFSVDCQLQRHDRTWRHVRLQAAPVYGAFMLQQWVVFLVDRTESLLSAQLLRASEERFRVLDDIGHATRHLRDPEDIMATTTRLLGQFMGATRCAYADVDADGDRFTIHRDWAQEGAPSSAGVYSLDLFGEQASTQMRRGVPLVLEDVDREIDDELGRRMFQVIDVKAIICAGLVKDGRLVAMMAIHQAVPRRWRPEELQIVSDVVERCWAHIERTRDAAILRDQDARKDEFIATLAHELRNPLAPIKYAVMLASRSTPAPAVQRKLEVIDRQVSLMARLIDDLLDVSRINRGLIDLQREDCDLASIVERSVEGALALIEAQRHHVTVHVPPGIMVNADPARMVQVIGNLLTNAAKYTPAGGQIAVVGRVEGGTAVLVVSDNGLGIQASDLGRLFQMFSQLRHTSAHAQGGLGLGLALVRKIVELHGGAVSASSPGLDLGSRFKIELPLSSLAADALRRPTVLTTHGLAEAQPASARPAEKSLKVMVVEDNDDGRETLVELLEGLGHEVLSAANGPDGLAMAIAETPALVLLDIGLPGLSGLQVAAALRERFPPERMALIALTGWGAAGDIARTKSVGFDLHLTKPIEVDILLDAVEEALKRFDPS